MIGLDKSCDFFSRFWFFQSSRKENSSLAYCSCILDGSFENQVELNSTFNWCGQHSNLEWTLIIGMYSIYSFCCSFNPIGSGWSLKFNTGQDSLKTFNWAIKILIQFYFSIHIHTYLFIQYHYHLPDIIVIAKLVRFLFVKLYVSCVH